MKSGVELGATPLGSRYRVLRELGQGGFGHTYLAEDLHRFNELCVLKEFVPQLEDPALLAKAKQLFEREANILYQLQHPQIPKFREILRVGPEIGHDGLFLVQDYVEGPTYRDLLQNRTRFGGHFSETEITQLLYQLLPVLDYIHSLGLIHRDISPENLILRNTDGLPVLIDFGSVKALAAEVQEQVSYGQSIAPPAADKTRIGKAGFVPPEQLQVGTTDPTSDLYGLAATALVLATGQEPEALYDAYHATWDWSQFVTLGPTLSQVLAQMLAPLAQYRFASASAVMAALKAAEVYPQGAVTAMASPTQPIPEAESSEAMIIAPTIAPPPALDTAPTVAVAPASEPSETSYVSPTAVGFSDETAYNAGCWQSVVGLLALLGLTGLLFWLFAGSNLPQWQLPLGDRNSSETPQTDSDDPNGRYSPEEIARKADLRTRREALGVSESYLTQLTDQVFYRQYPEMSGRNLTNSQEDAPLRLRWDNIASDLLDLMETSLSQRARRTLGNYGPANRETWRSTVGGLNVSSRALYDLADAKFAKLFPEYIQADYLSQAVGQIWYGLADDRVRDLESGASLEKIQFEPGTYSQQLTGQLAAGEGQVLTLNLQAGQILRLNLQAGSGNTLLSLYLPRPTEERPFLLSDSTNTTWSGRLEQAGFYEIVIVSKASELISYRLNIAVDNVTTTPQVPPAEDTPEEASTPGTAESGEAIRNPSGETNLPPDNQPSSEAEGVQF